MAAREDVELLRDIRAYFFVPGIRTKDSALSPTIPKECKTETLDDLHKLINCIVSHN
jgi:hypothetical protein